MWFGMYMRGCKHYFNPILLFLAFLLRNIGWQSRYYSVKQTPEYWVNTPKKLLYFIYLRFNLEDSNGGGSNHLGFLFVIYWHLSEIKSRTGTVALINCDTYLVCFHEPRILTIKWLGSRENVFSRQSLLNAF